MDKRLLFILITEAQFIVAFAQTRQYYFVNVTLNWTSAQSVCRRDYTDLATIETTADVEALLSTASNFTGKAWIGLYDELYNSWKWSLNDSSFYGVGEYEFRNWFPGSPNDLYGPQYCVRIFTLSTDALGRWDDRQCSDMRIFVCYNGTVDGTPSFVVSNISLNWTEAQKFCRENYIDLASIRNQTENGLISNLSSTLDMWIGLYRDKLWSDGSMSLFRHWADGQPSSDSGVQCAAAEFGSGRWYDEGCTQSLPFICYKQIPPNPKGFKSSAQDETSITLQWDKINNDTSFVLQFNGTETNISAPDGDGPVTHTVKNLSAGTKYTFNLLSVFENVRSSGFPITAATAPQNSKDFRPTAQNETSITLQWNKINNITSFVLQFNGTETNISAPAGDGAVTHTVQKLSAGNKYTFTLFSLYEDIRSSGVQLTAVTAPRNAESIRPFAQDKTTITLQWNKINNNTSFVLQFNGTETNISAPAGDGPVTHTVSSLTAGTKYTFTLLSVFENIRSSGVSLIAKTGPNYLITMDIKLESLTELSESEINDVLAEFFKKQGMQPQFTLKVRSATP